MIPWTATLERAIVCVPLSSLLSELKHGGHGKRWLQGFGSCRATREPARADDHAQADVFIGTTVHPSCRNRHAR